MRKILFLIPAVAAAMLLTGCDEDVYAERTVVTGGGGYYGGGYYDDDDDFYYSSGRPYSRSYGALVIRDGRQYYSRGGSYYVYDRGGYRDGYRGGDRNTEINNQYYINKNKVVRRGGGGGRDDDRVSRSGVNRTDYRSTQIRRNNEVRQIDRSRPQYQRANLVRQDRPEVRRVDRGQGQQRRVERVQEGRGGGERRKEKRDRED